MSSPIDPSQHEVSGITPREQRTLEGEDVEQAGQPFQLEKTSTEKVPQQEAIPPTSLQENLERVNTKVANLQQELTTERFNELTPGQRTLLDKKFAQFNANLQSLSKQLDLPYEPQKAQTDPLKTYIGWLTGGQSQIQSVAKSLAGKDPSQINPAVMLRAQANLQAAERAINFASAVAAKSADFIKTMMQTQI